MSENNQTAMTAPVSAETIEKAARARDAYRAECEAARRKDSQRVFGHPGASIPSAHPAESVEIGLMITAVRADLVAEALAPIRASLDEYRRTFATGDGRFIGDLLWNDIDRLLSAPVQAAVPVPEFVMCAECWSSVETCEGTDGCCCEACRATAGCTHGPSPVQATEEES